MGNINTRLHFIINQKTEKIEKIQIIMCSEAQYYQWAKNETIKYLKG